MKKYEVGIAHPTLGLLWVLKLYSEYEEQAKYKALFQAAHFKNADHTVDYIVTHVREIK